jgi:eukaryotic-like serine/threonine-protein kinase
VSDPYQTQGSQIIGEYRLRQKLGGGGFGNVYLAEHIYEHSQVAIKILQVPLVKPEDFHGFIKEAGTMTLLRHPHIIPLLYFNLSSEGLPFLVMEYAANGTLRDRHPKGSQVRLASIVEYVEQIASALQYAHDRRIIHRDVKPENMLLRADGTLLLSDFGIAKIMEQSTLMSVQTQIGTPVYMAPEQHVGRPCFASDQYALAVVVYEWLSGTRPFQGTSFGLAVQHMTMPPTPLLDLLPTLPPSIEQVVFKALSKAPEQRFATIQEFATAFRTVVQEANFSEVYMKKLPLEGSASHEALDKLPVTTASTPTEEEMKTPPAPHPIVTVSIHTEPQIKTPPVTPTPFTDQPIEADAQVGQILPEMNNPPASSQPSAPSPIAPIPTPPVVATRRSSRTVNVLRKLSPLERSLFLLGSVLLVGFIVLALVISKPSVKPQVSPKINTPVPSRSTRNESVLDANTVSRLVKKWTVQTGGPVESSPAVGDGIVYAGSWDRSVYAIDVQSGQKKWAFPTGDRVVSSPVVVDGVVYIGSDDNNVYAIEAQSGHKKWAFPTGGHVSSPPAVVAGVVYIGSQDGNIYAIDAQSGEKRWAFQTASTQRPPPQGPQPRGPAPPPPGPPPARPSSPVVVEGVVYISTPDMNVYAIDAQSGEKKWAFQTGGSVISSPAVVEGVVYVGSQDGNIYAIDAQSGQERWAFQAASSVCSPSPPVASSPTVVEGVVYIGSQDGNIYAIDAQSGQKKWAFPTGFCVVSSPAVVNGVVYVGSFDSNVYAIDAQSGEKKWTFQTGDIVHSSPIVVNGVVYVGSFDHNVYAFGLPETTS